MKTLARAVNILAIALVLAPVTVYCLAYFGLNHRVVARAIVDRLLHKLPSGVLTVQEVQLGPAPWEIHLFEVVIRGTDRQPRLRATHIATQMEWLTSSGTGPVLVLNGANGTDFDLWLDWNSQGQLALAEAFAKPRPPGVPKPPSKPSRFVLRIADIELTEGRVHLRFPGFGMDFQGVVARGSLAIGPLAALQIDASARGTHGVLLANGLPQILADRLRKRLGRAPADNVAPDAAWIPFDGPDIVDFAWRDNGFSARQVKLNLWGGPLTVTPAMDFPPKQAIRFAYTLDGTLSADLVTTLLGGGPATAVTFAGRAEGQPAAVRFQLDRFEAPQLQVAGLRLAGLKLAGLRSEERSGQAHVWLDSLQLARLDGPADQVWTDARLTARADLQSPALGPGAVGLRLMGQADSFATWLMGLPEMHLDVQLQQVELGRWLAPPWDLLGAHVETGQLQLQGMNGRLTLGPLRAASAKLAGYPLEAPEVGLEMALDGMTARLQRLSLTTASEQVRITGQGSLKYAWPLQFPFTLEARAQSRDGARFVQWLQKGLALPAGIARLLAGGLSGLLRFEGDLLRRKSPLRLEGGELRVERPTETFLFSITSDPSSSASLPVAWQHDPQRREIRTPGYRVHYQRVP